MTHRFSFACCLAPVLALLAAAPGPAAAQGYDGLPLFNHDVRARLGKRHQGRHGDTAAGRPNAGRAGRIGERALPAPGACRARVLRLGAADAVAADRSSFRRKAVAPRRRARCRRNSRRQWCPASRDQFPTCRTVPRHSRTARRAAPSSKASMACRGPQAIATWARACNERHSGAPRSGEPEIHSHRFAGRRPAVEHVIRRGVPAGRISSTRNG